MGNYRIFLASSAELEKDRREFEIQINRRNKAWAANGVFLELVVWEDFLDAVSQTRLQDEYNKAIAECDVFVMLFWTEVGKYTEEEFDRAFAQFQASRKPFIFTYFKDAPIDTGSVDDDDLMSLLLFKKKLKALGHFHTTYKNVEGLQLHFLQQLDKLVASGFIEFPPRDAAGAQTAGVAHQADLRGDGAIAHGAGATAIGAGGVSVRGNNAGDINTGTRIDTGGGAYVGGNVHAGRDFTGRDKVSVSHGVTRAELESLFAPLRAAVARQAAADTQAAAGKQVDELKTEVAKGRQADDGRIAKIVDGLFGLVPGAVGSVVGMFATPLLGGIAGPVTKWVLDKWKTN